MATSTIVILVVCGVFCLIGILTRQEWLVAMSLCPILVVVFLGIWYWIWPIPENPTPECFRVFPEYPPW